MQGVSRGRCKATRTHVSISASALTLQLHSHSATDQLRPRELDKLSNDTSNYPPVFNSSCCAPFGPLTSCYGSCVLNTYMHVSPSICRISHIPCLHACPLGRHNRQCRVAAHTHLHFSMHFGGSVSLSHPQGTVMLALPQAHLTSTVNEQG